MRKKTTDELLSILANEKNIKNYIKDNQNEFETRALHEELERLLEKHSFSFCKNIKLTLV